MEKDQNESEKKIAISLVRCSELQRIGETETLQLYERLCQKAEEDRQRETWILAEVNENCLVEVLKAIFRAAIFGNLSLLFGGVQTEDEVEKAKAAAQIAFREMLESGKEFNGYLPKGILIDTPLALISKLPTQGFDFFCLDLLRICEGMIGKETVEPKDWNAIQEILARHLQREIPMSAILSEELRKSGAAEWLKKEKILEIDSNLPTKSDFITT